MYYSEFLNESRKFLYYTMTYFTKSNKIAKIVSGEYSLNTKIERYDA